MHETASAKPLREQFVTHDGSSELWDDLVGLGKEQAVRRYRASVGCFDDRMFEMDDAQLDQAWLADAGVGRWSIRSVVGHLADAELILTNWIRRAVVEPGFVTPGWDESSWNDAGLYTPASELPEGMGFNEQAPPIGGFVATIYTTRQWTGEWLGSLADGVWDNQILHIRRGPLSVRELVAMNTWHLEHHAWYLNAKVTKLLGPREACEPGSCGNPACACAGGEGAKDGAGA